MMSAYKWSWVNTSEGERVQVQVSAYKWLWVNTSKGECIQVKVGEYKLKVSEYKWR